MKLDIQLFADGKVVIDTELNSKDFEKGLDKMENSTKKAGSTIKNIVAGLGITKIISSGINMITSSLDDATKRFDTLNNFPKVMNNLGIATKDADKQITRMSEALAGLPTTLDQGAMAVQRFTSKNGDVKKSTDIFLALNNAILAGGASTEIQSSALEQLSQSYSKGKMDMMEWRTIQMAMPAQLKQVATAMGVTTDQLGEMLREGDNTAEVMDNFMDTIIQLNKEGSNGFASFEKQARNSTSGIRTAITVAKTQVVKGVADMITGINKGLKKSKLGSLSDIISNLGKEAKKVLDKVAKVLSKIDFGKLYNAIKTLVPIVGTLTAAFVSYNAVMKAMQIASAVSNFASLTAKFITLIPTINSASAGMLALNGAISVSPIGILIASVAGLTAGIYLLHNAYQVEKEDIDKVNDTLTEYDETMKNVDKNRQKYLDTHMNEIQNTKTLWGELEHLVDENGKVKEGYEDRVNYILGELNGALGTEMKQIDGVIQGYQGVRQSINDVIASKRANVLLDAEEEKYNKAKDQRNKLEQAYATAQTEYNNKTKERNKVLKEIQETYGLTNKQMEEVSKTLSYTDENGKKVSLSFEELGQKLAIINGEYGRNKNVLEEAGRKYKENEKIINDYEFALENLQKGNYNVVTQMYEDTTNYQGKTNQETAENYKGAIESQKKYLEDLKKNKNLYDEDYYNNLVKAKENEIALLEEKQKEVEAKEKASQSTLTSVYEDGIDTRIDKTKKKNPEFTKAGLGNTNSFANGIQNGKANVNQKSKEVGDTFEGQLNRYNQAYSKGQNASQGYANGIASLVGSVRNAAANLANQAMAAIQQAQNSHSPSKKTKGFGKDFVDGYTLGIEENEKDTINAVSNYAKDVLNELSSNDFNSALNDIYGSMQRAVDFETGKISSNIELGNASKNISQMINASASFDGTINVEANLDGEKVWENQQKVRQRKNLQYGGIR